MSFKAGEKHEKAWTEKHAKESGCEEGYAQFGAGLQTARSGRSSHRVDHWSPSFGEFLVVDGSGVGSDILVKAEFWAPSTRPR